MIARALFTLLILTASAAVHATPLCSRVGTGLMVPCWSDAKINAAVRIVLRHRSVKNVGELRDTLISFEINRGKFASAAELASFYLGAWFLTK